MASYFSWTRAAYVFFVLSLLAALLKIGGSSIAEPRAFVSTSPNEPAEPAVETTVAQSTTIESTTVEGTTARHVHEHRSQTRSVDTTHAETTRMETTVTRSSSRRSPVVRISDNSPAGEEPPVFYRPSPRVPLRDAPTPPTGRGETGVSAQGTGPVCGDLGALPKSSKAVFPLSDAFFDSYSDTWGAPRPQGGHEGTDLMTPAGTPEYAITNGTIVPVSGANGNGWNTLGGYTVMLRADYDVGPIKAGDLFYYAHMQKESELAIGTRVRAGQLLGYAGDTGQGPEITSGLFPPHLHLGWYDASGARTNLASGAMNPFPLLEWLKANGGAVAGGSDVEYCEAPQPPAPIPSTGGGTWTYPTSPGTRPDIDTGTGDARPSPAMEKPENSAEQAPGVKREEPPRRNAPASGAKEPPVSASPEPKPAAPVKPAVPDVPRPRVGDVEPPALPGEDAPRKAAPRPPRVGVGGPADDRVPAPPRVSVIRGWVTDLLEPVPGGEEKGKRPVRDRDREPGPKDRAGQDKRQKEKPDGPRKPRHAAPKPDAGCDARDAAEPCDEDTGIEEKTTQEESPPEATTDAETTESVSEETVPPASDPGSASVPEATRLSEPLPDEPVPTGSPTESSIEPAPEEGTTQQ